MLTFRPHLVDNKKEGLKNLRCFPSCGAEHRERGFCGQSLVIAVTHPDLGSDSPRKLFAFATFVEVSSPCMFSFDQSVPLAYMQAQSRTKEQPMLPWIPSQVVKNDYDSAWNSMMMKGSSNSSATETTLFEFNRERRGWHYGWTSNKHMCNVNHAFEVSIFELNDTVLTCKLVARSPEFILFCRRRKRFNLEPRAPVSKPIKKIKLAPFPSPVSSPTIGVGMDLLRAIAAKYDEEERGAADVLCRLG